MFWAIYLYVHHIECHNCIFKSDTWVSDGSVHMDYHIALITKAWDGRKVYWDSRKQATRQFFTTSNSVQNTIIWSLASCKCNYVFCNLIVNLKSEISPAPCNKKCCSEHQTLFALVESLGTRLGCNLRMLVVKWLLSEDKMWSCGRLISSTWLWLYTWWEKQSVMTTCDIV